MMHPESQEVLGGLWGSTSYSYLHVDAVFVPEALRGTGLGRKLMLMAENEAVARGCIGAWLDTFSFQACGFYEKLGYQIFGWLHDNPPGHTRFFLKKSFSPSA
jgi:GNAT superfamily N-acetyltransferase